MNDVDIFIIYFKANIIGCIGYPGIVREPKAENPKKRLLNLKMDKLEKEKKKEKQKGDL